MRAPAELGRRERVRRRRVEVADHDVDVEPERDRALDAAVGGDDGRPGGHRDGGARPRCDDDDVRLDHAFLRWHYPGQVLRVGGALAALSARLPELPGSLPRILSVRALEDAEARLTARCPFLDVDGVDARLRGPEAEPGDEHRNVVGRPLELRLDRPVGVVAPSRRRRAPRRAVGRPRGTRLPARDRGRRPSGARLHGGPSDRARDVPDYVSREPTVGPLGLRTGGEAVAASGLRCRRRGLGIGVGGCGARACLEARDEAGVPDLAVPRRHRPRSLGRALASASASSASSGSSQFSIRRPGTRS